MSRSWGISLPVRVAFFILFICSVAFGQATVGTGAIRGKISDPTGAVTAAANVTITNKATAAVNRTASSTTGEYSSGPLLPGDYKVRIEAKGFKTAELSVTVRVSVISEGSVELQAGKESEVIQVPGTQALLNTQQPTVQTVLASDLTDTLPIGGRNYLDLAQLGPNVQFEDAGSIDPRKLGMAAVSIQGQSGRGVRYEVDGVSISDEIAGTTTQNVPASAILEFNVARSFLDLPTELTSSGTVNVSTRSGGNDLHGEAFGYYRGKQGSAALPGGDPLSFQREHYGARFGGALAKDKWFWFLDGERIQQNLNALIPFDAPFNTLNTSLSQPFRELQGDGRLDWQRSDNAHAFYRFSYDQVSQVGPFGGRSLQGLREATHTPTHTLGYDFTRGNYTHSIRFEYLRLRNGIGDDTATIPAGVNNPVPGLGISIGAPISGDCGLSGTGGFCAGPSPYAPQVNIQSNYLARYDGSRVWGDHVLRFGVTYDRIQAGGFSALFANPQVGTTSTCLPGSILQNCLTSADPTAYPAEFAFLGNGSGFSTASSAFGYSGGGLGPDNRIEAYLGDGWRYKRNLLLTLGLRYTRETGRVDHGLGGLSILNQWLPSLGNPVRNPNTDFAPQFGAAWDIGGAGKTVLRGGAGLYYDSSLWSNMLLDARARSRNGMLTYTPEVCSFGNATPFTWPTTLGGGTAAGSPVAGGAGVVTNPATNQVAPTFCGSSISSAEGSILALSSAFQAAASSVGSGQANPNFIANTLSATNINGLDVFHPDFLTPRVIQLNGGFQTELSEGMVLSVDYVRTIGTHSLMVMDQNHSGAARSYNFQNAMAARDNAQLAAGCTVGLGEAPCMVSRLGSVAAAQSAYSAAGLDSNSATTGGAPCSFCAFPGYTPFGVNIASSGGGDGSLGTLDTLSTIGRSLYWGGQVRLVQRFARPLQGIKTANVQVAYTYSKFVSPAGDQNLASVATNNDLPLQFTGPNGMDRKHQISFGGTFELPWLTHLSFFGHFYSPLAQTLSLPELTNGGEIFASDWIGSGLGSGGAPEPLKGTGIGQYNRGGTDITTLQHVISDYNTHFAGTFTPAGHCLVADQVCPGSAPIAVMTASDMATLGWVMPTVPSVSPFASSSPWLKTFDLRASWPIKIGDRVTVVPSASAFNIFNFANYFVPGNLPGASLYSGPNPTLVPSGILAPNVIGGATSSSLSAFRAGLQSGTFAAGAPRQLEFGLRINF